MGVLDGWERDRFVHAGKGRNLFRRGDGPAVLVLAEMPGITPEVVGFGERVVALGCTAVLPHLFGEPGGAPSTGAFLRTFAPLCVSREFSVWATGRTSPVIGWLRALARHEHARRGGPGVGAVGMCLTGGFALGMMVDPTVVAPVLSQPSLPLAISARRRRDLHVSPTDLGTVKQRCTSEPDLCLLGLRFSHDRLAPAARFARLRGEFGDSFVGVEIDSSPDNPHGIRKGAHSVLTEDLVDEPGHPTRDALEQVLDLFRRRLLSGADG
jgi:dienelactone hydrolase